MSGKVTTSTQTVFDQIHYLELIEARGKTIRRIVEEMQAVASLSTALDAGCGLGFFSAILQEAGLRVLAFDGRRSNVEEAARRYPRIPFQEGDIEAERIRELGQFDLVLCFGLLYHLEDPFGAIRNLHALTKKYLLLESMCFSDEEPWMLLREEPSYEDQSLTDVAFYASEGCLVKMLYRAGFAAVYRVAELPEHDDFRDTAEHSRKRTVLVASAEILNLASLRVMREQTGSADPWLKEASGFSRRSQRFRRLVAGSALEKVKSLARKMKSVFRQTPFIKLPFGAGWFLEGSALDESLRAGRFETSEMRFVERFLKESMTVLDIGAHHGLYTLLASILVGKNGKVIAFEPSPRERLRLERHLRLNRCRNVHIEGVALDQSAGESDLFLVGGSQDYCNSLRPPAVLAKTTTVRVKVVTLDEYLVGKSVLKVDFIKLDVEGAELGVLRGGKRVLTTVPRPVLLIEVYDIRTLPWGYAGRDIVGYLSGLGYRWYRVREDGTLEPIASSLKSYDMNLVAVPQERANEFAGLQPVSEAK